MGATTGQGSVSISQKQDPPGSGPFAAGAANNGLSVDTVTGKIVFGNDQTFTQGGTAKLLNNREIDLAGFGVSFIDDVGAGLQNMGISIGNIFSNDLNTGNLASLQTGATIAALFLNSAGGGTSLINFNGAPAIYNIENNNAALIVRDSGANQLLSLDALNDNYLFGDITGLATQSFFQIDSGNGRIEFFGGGSRIMELLPLTHIAQFGDIDSVAAGLIAKVDAFTQQFDVRNTALTAIYSCNGQTGFTGTVTPVVSITVEGGIVTNVT